jgi:hypothetical protein
MRWWLTLADIESLVMSLDYTTQGIVYWEIEMLELKAKKAFNYTGSRQLPVVKRVIAFVSQLSASEPQQIGASKLREVFGKETNEFAKHLKLMVLFRTSKQYIKGLQYQQYVRKDEGFNQLKELAGISDEEVGTLVAEQYTQWNPEIQSGVFVYNEQSNRFYHPLQSIIKKVDKPAFWRVHGYNHDIDIDNAAPTLLYQLALKSKCPRMLLGDIKKYIDDKSGVRTYYSELLQCDYETAKEVITALFNGARLNYQRCSIAKLLNSNQIGILRKDNYTKQLRSTIKLMWKYLGRSERIMVNGKNRWAVYRRLERQVMDVVVQCCEGRVFREHDGLRTDTMVDIVKIVGVVKNNTGYEIAFSYKYNGE